MHYLLGTLALLGIGLIGLLIESRKQDKLFISNLETENDALKEEQQILLKNQKPAPWNKGKKYTLPRGINGKVLRKPKEYADYTSISEAIKTGEVGQELFTPRID